MQKRRGYVICLKNWCAYLSIFFDIKCESNAAGVVRDGYVNFGLQPKEQRNVAVAWIRNQDNHGGLKDDDHCVELEIKKCQFSCDTCDLFR